MSKLKRFLVLLLSVAVSFNILFACTSCGHKEEELEITAEEVLPEENTTPKKVTPKENKATPKAEEPIPSAKKEETTQEQNTPVEVNDNPQGVDVNAGGIKLLLAPAFDPFPLQYPFNTAYINSSDQITKIEFIVSNPSGNDVTTYTDKETIKTIWNDLESTQVTSVGVDTANPSTGGNLQIKFYFDDNSTATIKMLGLVFFNDEGPFLLVDPEAENHFWSYTY